MKMRIFILLGMMVINMANAVPKIEGLQRWKSKVIEPLTSEEEALFLKLGTNQRRFFALMNSKQRNAVVSAAKEEATADAAIEKVMGEEHLILIKGKLEVKMKKH